MGILIFFALTVIAVMFCVIERKMVLNLGKTIFKKIVSTRTITQQNIRYGGDITSNTITNSFGFRTGNISSKTVNGKSIVRVNGKTYTGNGDVVVKNNQIYIGGKLMNGGENGNYDDHTIVVEGDIGSLSTDLSVTVMGHVTGGIFAGGSVHCDDVEGDVTVHGGSVRCDNVKGNVNSRGSVRCDNVGGNVDAMGSVNYG